MPNPFRLAKAWLCPVSSGDGAPGEAPNGFQAFSEP